MVKICTSCSDKNSSQKLFCDDCGKVCKIKLLGKLAFFSIFSLEPAVDLDKKILDKKYAELMSMTHPDRFINFSEDAKLIAEANAAMINEAYSILSSEIGICEYILNNINEGKTYEVIEDENDFLTEKIALYEELGSIDSTTGYMTLKNKLDTIYVNRVADLRNNIAKQNWEHANKDLQKLKFIIKLFQDLEKNSHSMLEIDEKVHKK